MPSRTLRLAGLALAVLAAGCGRVESSETSSPDDASTSADATSSRDASPDSAPTGLTGLGVDAAYPTYDAGTCTAADASSLAGRVPVSHRSSGTTCPAGRGSGDDFSSCDFDAGSVACVQDSDCTAGKEGRCFLHPRIPPPPACEPPSCSYDQCESDSDCAGVPCDCRSSAASSSANVCATGSRCVVDSDCGSGGYCSPGGFVDAFCSDPVYFCHGPADECIDDTDCCYPTHQCAFDATKGHFACMTGCIPPP